MLSITHSSGAITLNSQAYAYDALGNRISNTTNVAQPLITQAANSTYDAENHLLQSGATTYVYDANGNRISQTSPAGTTTYVWDSRNRLQSVSTPDGQTTTFTYDFEGNLISQTTGGGGANLSRTFLLDNLTNVVYQTVNGVGSLILTGRLIDQHLAVLESGQSIFGLVDALNSTAVTADQGGSTVARFFYEPFGQTTRSGADYPFQYTGRVPVAGGLYYYRSRYYDPMASRFISEDPIGFSGGINLYEYVNNNPVNLADPTGKAAGALVLPCMFGPVPCVVAAGVAAGAVGIYLATPAGQQAARDFATALSKAFRKTMEEPCRQPALCNWVGSWRPPGELPSLQACIYRCPWGEEILWWPQYFGCPSDWVFYFDPRSFP